MPEQKELSLYQQQKAAKPMIEDVIPDYLDGEMRKAALDFVAHMRANKMKPVWYTANSWKAIYKSKCICVIKLRNDDWKNAEHSWSVHPYLNYMSRYG